MDEYKYIEQQGGEPVLINLEGETILLSDIFVDMYVSDEDSTDIGMSETQLARKYDLNENQVAEAQTYFRDDEDFLNDFSYSDSSDTVFEVVDRIFHFLSSKYEDVEKQVLDNSGDADISYQLNVGENKLEADIEQNHVCLSDDQTDITLKVEKGDIEDQVQILYNGMRMRNE